MYFICYTNILSMWPKIYKGFGLLIFLTTPIVVSIRSRVPWPSVGKMLRLFYMLKKHSHPRALTITFYKGKFYL